MKLSSMRFKDYVWPHNPRVYEIGFRRNVAVHQVPFGAYVLQNMGRRNRVLRGEGAFAGAGAYAEFKKLATVFYDATPGVLVHPLWDTATAYFVSLALKQEPAEDYVAYTFEFWECFSGYEPALGAPQSASGAGPDPEYYTARAGESLWDVALARGTDVSLLLALNPWVKNPNVLSAGDAVRVR